MRVADLERAGRGVAERLIARTVARLPISPTALTVTAVVLSVGVTVLLALGYLPWAAALMLVSAGFDAADGALARVTRRTSDLGGFLDSTLDRYTEVLAGLGLLIYLLQRGAWPDLILLYLFVTGGLIFSYARARAEAAGFSSRDGLFTRPVRILVLALGLLLGQLHVALWVLAVGVQVSGLYRLLGVCAEARRRDFPQTVLSWPRRLGRLPVRRSLGEAEEEEPPAV
jgi:CDP-diacylglycerol--glycerol-3-phosphate 3-phosphatidyltransferase